MAASAYQEKLKQEQAEMDAIKAIKREGLKVGLSWYKWNNEYYQILGNKIGYSRQKRLTVNVPEDWYILDLNNVNACVLYINGIEKTLAGVDPETISVYKDHFYTFRTPNNGPYQLWRGDQHFITADSIKRLTQDLWSLQSNGKYYLSNLDERYTRAIGESELMVDDIGIYYIYQDYRVDVIRFGGVINE